MITRVQPKYPEEARQNRVSGTVRMHAIIATAGSLKQLDVLSGDPLLMKAAVDALRKWRYRPATIDGEPVEIDTVVDMIFTLSK